jgi:hypothetical protein
MQGLITSMYINSGSERFSRIRGLRDKAGRVDGRTFSNKGRAFVIRE